MAAPLFTQSWKRGALLRVAADPVAIGGRYYGARRFGRLLRASEVVASGPQCDDIAVEQPLVGAEGRRIQLTATRRPS